MSLAHSHHGPLGGSEEACTKLRVREAEPRPRALQRPDTYKDLKTATTASFAGGETQPRLLPKHSGNAKPQEPAQLAMKHRTVPHPKDRTAEIEAQRKELAATLERLEPGSEEWKEASRTLRRLRVETLPPTTQIEHRPERPRMSGQALHSKPWSSSAQPGHRENAAAGDNRYHRVWMTDSAVVGKGGKWSSARTKQHYLDQDKALLKLRPHDEIFAVKTNMKYWTHLEGGGSAAGGQHKIEVMPQKGPCESAQDPGRRCCCAAGCERGMCERTGLHLKSGLYRGKFQEVRHRQLVFQRVGDAGAGTKLVCDKRPMFDNRVNDDVIRYIHERDKETAVANFDMYRPAHTYSCPQLGADYVRR